MDPTANLKNQLELASRVVYLSENKGSDEDIALMGYELAEYVIALDEWISKGGFLPKQWGRHANLQTPDSPQK